MVTNVLNLLCTVNCTPVPTTYRFCVLYLHFEGFLLKCFDRNNHLDLLTRTTIRESKRILCSKALDTNSPPQVYNSACSKSLSRMRTMTLQNSRVVCGSQCSVCIARPQAPPKIFWAGPGDEASVCMMRLWGKIFQLNLRSSSRRTRVP